MTSYPDPTDSLPELIERFGTEDKCHEYLEHLRWPEGVRCPRCDADTISRLKERRQYECSKCEYQFSVRVGTVLHDSKLPLWKWFLATFLMIQSKKGISASQLGRMVGVSYKTAWYLCHRIRSAMVDDGHLLDEIVEVDETYVGGHRWGSGRGYKGNKSLVLGAVERGGNIKLKVGRSRDGKELGDFIREAVSDHAEALYTDSFSGYGAAGLDDHKHETVNHSKNEWVRGQVHTNTVESVWSLLQRSIIGSYHQLSKKHLPAYLDEIAFRHNNRDNPYMFRDTIRRICDSDTLRYADLTH